jgi:hypothetical protein
MLRGQPRRLPRKQGSRLHAAEPHDLIGWRQIRHGRNHRAPRNHEEERTYRDESTQPEEMESCEPPWPYLR